jgi:hypothetical protein
MPRFGFMGPQGDLTEQWDPQPGLPGSGDWSAGRPWWLPHCLPYCYGDPNHPSRHVGRGHPLVGTSWLNRPWHADTFVGAAFFDPLTARVQQNDNIIGGYRVGKDFDHYWGWEARFAFAFPRTWNADTGVILGHSRLVFYDASLAYYPWGDARWRPYLTAGLGLTHARFADENGRRYGEVLPQVPLGFGVKYQLKRWLALRVDFMDHWSVGSSGLRTMHNYAITGGFEARLGGPRTSYYPYHRGIHLW